MTTSVGIQTNMSLAVIENVTTLKIKKKRWPILLIPYYYMFFSHVNLSIYFPVIIFKCSNSGELQFII